MQVVHFQFQNEVFLHAFSKHYENQKLDNRKHKASFLHFHHICQHDDQNLQHLQHGYYNRQTYKSDFPFFELKT